MRHQPPRPSTEAVFQPLTFRSVSLHDEYGQLEDVENYIKLTVSSNIKMRRWKPEHKQLVIDVLTERAVSHRHLTPSQLTPLALL